MRVKCPFPCTAHLEHRAQLICASQMCKISDNPDKTKCSPKGGPRTGAVVPTSSKNRPGGASFLRLSTALKCTLQEICVCVRAQKSAHRPTDTQHLSDANHKKNRSQLHQAAKIARYAWKIALLQHATLVAGGRGSVRLVCSLYPKECLGSAEPALLKCARRRTKKKQNKNTPEDIQRNDGAEDGRLTTPEG